MESFFAPRRGFFSENPRGTRYGLQSGGKGGKLLLLRKKGGENMVSIVEVTTKAQLRRFVEYPIELYKDVPQYIPGTYDDDLQDWDRKKEPRL